MKDGKDFLEKFKVKWYWFIPVIGYILYVSETQKFMFKNKFFVMQNGIQDENYEYEEMALRNMYISKTFIETRKRQDELVRSTFGLINLLKFVLLILNIAINSAPLIYKSMIKKTINKNEQHQEVE